MKSLWVILGRAVYWLVWPLLVVYLRFTTRTRVLVVVGDEVLLTKGWLGSGKWVLPGGGLHRGENPVKGALRELYEETGLRLRFDTLTDYGTTNARDSGLRFRYHRFAAKLPVKPAFDRRRSEVVEVRWVPIPDLNPETAEQSTLDTLTAWKSRQ